MWAGLESTFCPEFKNGLLSYWGKAVHLTHLIMVNFDKIDIVIRLSRQISLNQDINTTKKVLRFMPFCKRRHSHIESTNELPKIIHLVKGPDRTEAHLSHSQTCDLN